MTCFAIGSNLNELGEFRDVFGMRFVGLVDSGSAVYQRWRVPNPTAPYPQDYVIDPNGIIRYWSDQFDPQAVVAVIDRLLATGVEATTSPLVSGDRSEPTVIRGALNLQSAISSLQSDIVLIDVAGRKVMKLRAGPNNVSRLAPGVYFVQPEPQAPSLKHQTIRRVVLTR